MTKTTEQAQKTSGVIYLSGNALLKIFPRSRGKQRAWFFTLRAANDERLATSETFTHKRDALRAVEATQLAAVEVLVEVESAGKSGRK